MATNLGLKASIYDNSAKQNIAWFNCLAYKHAVPVSAGINKSLVEKILKSFYESWENYANTKLRIVKISSARELEVWEMWLFTVELHQYAIKGTQNFTMSSLKIPVLKNIPRLHVNIFYSSKEVFICDFWSAFETSAVSLVGFKTSWNLFYGNKNVVFVKMRVRRCYLSPFPDESLPCGQLWHFPPFSGPKMNGEQFFFLLSESFCFLRCKTGALGKDYGD